MNSEMAYLLDREMVMMEKRELIVTHKHIASWWSLMCKAPINTFMPLFFFSCSVIQKKTVPFKTLVSRHHWSLIGM